MAREGGGHCGAGEVVVVEVQHTEHIEPHERRREGEVEVDNELHARERLQDGLVEAVGHDREALQAANS